MSKIFCIDIGGTRIKGAVLDERINFKDLKNIRVKVIRTLGWLNSSLARIISQEHFGSLTYDNDNEEFEIISIGVPLKVKNSGLNVYGHYKDKNGVPSNLIKELNYYSDCEVRIMNDAAAWIRGIHNYAFLNSLKLKYPLLCIILGTGVGVAYLDDKLNVKTEEMSDKKLKFSNLSKVTNAKINEGWKIHKLLGDEFFNYLKKHCYQWTYEKIREEYTKRILALLLDMKKHDIMNFKKARTIVIAGGNNEYVIEKKLKTKIDKNFLTLVSNKVQINPDIIPLLGHLNLNKK